MQIGGEYMQNITLEALLDRIYCATEEELNPILNAITERFGELWPEWELATLSIHGHDRESHLEALQKSIGLLKN